MLLKADKMLLHTQYCCFFSLYLGLFLCCALVWNAFAAGWLGHVWRVDCTIAATRTTLVIHHPGNQGEKDNRFFFFPLSPPPLCEREGLAIAVSLCGKRKVSPPPHQFTSLGQLRHMFSPLPTQNIWENICGKMVLQEGVSYYCTTRYTSRERQMTQSAVTIALCYCCCRDMEVLLHCCCCHCCRCSISTILL